MRSKTIVIVIMSLCCVWSAAAKISGWNTAPNTQYHIQTDEGSERYFRYQTISGQYRKEKRLRDGSVVGTYGWVDANGYLRLRDYVADDKGYRIVNSKVVRVGVNMPTGQRQSISEIVTNRGGDGSLYQSAANQGGITAAAIRISPQKPTSERPAPISLSDYLKEKQYENSTFSPIAVYFKNVPNVEIINNGLPIRSTSAPISYNQWPEVTTASIPVSLDNGYQSTPPPTSLYSTTTPPTYFYPQTFRPYYNRNAGTYNDKDVTLQYDNAQSELPQHNGIAVTNNGYRYSFPQHTHDEENLQRAGSFGYVDPFGMRRVMYYKILPNSGYDQRESDRY